VMVIENRFEPSGAQAGISGSQHLHCGHSVPSFLGKALAKKVFALNNLMDALGKFFRRAAL
jgi:hypothetical protein